MSIEVRCRCGNILAVDATHAGREAYCAKCGAAVPIVHETESDRTAEESQVKDPDEAKAPDETGEKKDSSSEIVSGSALFAEAIAAFNELEDRTAEGDGSEGKGKKAGKKRKKAKKAETGPKKPEKKPKKGRSKSKKKPGAKNLPEETKKEAPPGDHAAPTEEPDSPPPSDAVPTMEYKVAPPEAAPVDKAPGKKPKKEDEDESSRLVEVEPGTSEGGKAVDVPGAPTSVEIYEDRVKFTCPCGKRISAPIQSTKATGKCPRCGKRLAIPSVKAAAGAPKGAPAPAKETGPRCRACGKRQPEPGAKFCSSCGATINAKPAIEAAGEGRTSARIAADDAADRLRKKPAEPPKPEVAPAKDRGGPPPHAGTDEPASIIGRMLAFLIDLTSAIAVLLLVFVALKGSLGSGTAQLLSVVLASLAWFANEVAFSAVNGQTVGKALVRISVRRAGDGGLADIKTLVLRAVVKFFFLPGAVMAVFDDKGRAAHDAASGSMVVQGWHPPGKGAGGSVA